MASSALFDHVCAELQRHTSLDRLAARGTLRLSLKEAGLDATSVSGEQMQVVLRRVLPAQLASRGIDSGEELCATLAAAVSAGSFEAGHDRAGAAAATMNRLGS